jgi:GT2 family glycosyltransferase
MRLSVVTVNWNSCDDLAACLASLEGQSYRDVEVIVVDNGSTDGSVEMVRNRFSQFTLLPQASNLGFAEACNIGIAASSGPWVALLNNDAIADPRWAERLMVAAEGAHESCGMLQSLMLFMSQPPKVNSTGIVLTRIGGGKDRGEGDEPPSAGAEVEPIFCPCGGAAAYRRSMLEAVKLSTGYLDAEHFCYYEDLDLGWRARLQGYEAIYVPDSLVHHKYHGSTSRRSSEWHTQVTVTNRVRTLLKNASGPFLLTTLWRSLKELVHMWRVCGSTALPSYFEALAHSLRLRGEVESRRRRPRRAVERHWVIS